MYLVKTPIFIQKFFPNFIWRIPNAPNQLFLSFDDGPIPEVTPWVLDTLAKYNAKASFFCVGHNVKKHPEIYQRILDEGHTVGNHSYHHLNGWTTENIPYFHNIRQAASCVKSDLFRPPYGKLKPRQAQFLQRHYAIVMWDILSGDFDAKITIKQCFQNVAQNATSGSIIVFHDSLKSWRILENVLPAVLKHFSQKSFEFIRLRKEHIVKKRRTA